MSWPDQPTSRFNCILYLADTLAFTGICYRSPIVQDNLLLFAIIHHDGSNLFSISHMFVTIFFFNYHNWAL